MKYLTSESMFHCLCYIYYCNCHCCMSEFSESSAVVDGAILQELFVHLSRYCSAYTMDVIASTGFGLRIDSHNDPNNMFVQMANKLFDFSATNLRVFLFR